MSKKKPTLAFTMLLAIEDFIAIDEFYRANGLGIAERGRIAREAMEDYARIIKTKHPEFDHGLQKSVELFNARYGSPFEGNRKSRQLALALGELNLETERKDVTGGARLREDSTLVNTILTDLRVEKESFDQLQRGLSDIPDMDLEE